MRVMLIRRIAVAAALALVTVALQPAQAAQAIGPLSTIVEQPFPAVSSNERVAATATCPALYRVVGGGFRPLQSSGAGFGAVSANYPSASNSWTVSGVYGPEDTASAYAVCVLADLTTTIQSVTFSGQGEVACPSGTVGYGGGYQHDNPSIGAYNSYPTERGWSVDNGYIGSYSGTVYVICGSLQLGRSVQSAYSSGRSPSASVTCPGLTGQLIGGGFRTKDVLASKPSETTHSYPSASNEWTAAAVPVDDRGGASIDAYAVCAVLGL